MIYKQIMAIALSISVLVTQTLYAANLEIDSSAPKANKAFLEKAPNGVPIVNIVTPTAQGLSHNKFKSYNVDAQGLILNNSKVVTNTELAGYISYNKNLTANNAKLILNEVTGTNRSLLKGYTEVAGKAADVIVANPNGITVNGGGFINTPKATLTTGNPFINGGALQGFDVSRGDILVEGAGFNVENIDKVNLYTKALQLNAKLYAKELNVVTGKNNIALDGTVTKQDNIGTGISIDSSLLGGIYANTISLVSNDKGVGINLPPEVYAQDSLSLSADGDIVLSKLIANNDLNVKSTDGNIKSTSEIGSDTILIEAQKNIDILEDSVIEGTSSLQIVAKENIDNKGKLSALGDYAKITIKTDTDLSNSGKIYAKNDALITAETLQNNDLIQVDDDLQINTTTFNNTIDGVVYAKDTATVVSNTIDNDGIVAAANLDMSADSIDNQGALYTTNDMTIVAKTLTNHEMIRSNNEINLLIEDSLTNKQNGVIYGDGKITIAANEAKDKINTVTNSGLIQSDNNINITAKKLDNKASTPTFKNNTTTNTKTISRGGSNDYDVVTTTTSTQVIDIPSDPALILAEGNIAIDVETLDNYYSLISSDGDISLNADTTNNIGKILITTNTIVTKQYRNEKYCSSSGPSGVCFKHKNRAGYRGTFTQTDTAKVPVVNYGIQAKRNITGNVVTLNNVNNATILTNQEIAQKQTLAGDIESNTVALQEVIDELDSTNEETIAILDEVQNLDTLVDGIQTDDDLALFKADLLTMQNSFQASIDKDEASVASLEDILAYSRTLDTTDIMMQEITALETSIQTLKDNVALNKTNMLSFQTINDAIVVVEDAALQKQALVDVNTDMKNITSNNSQIIQDIETDSTVDTLVKELETISDKLQSEVKESLDLQQTTTQTLVTTEDGLYQTGSSTTLESVDSASYQTNVSSDAFISNLSLPKSKFGLFVINTSKEHPYLIESNPLYTNYKTFIGSDYMMSQLDYRPEKTIQRLGDAMYETTLVRNSIIQLSGKRYLNEYGSDLQQFQALMDNALAVEDDLNLALGVALSKEQIAGLTKDIVWMEERTVEGQKVLVPVVYLVSIDEKDMLDGAVIQAGENLTLAATKTVKNQGAMRSGVDLDIEADDIINQGGTISAKNDVVLDSKNSIENVSGNIQAGENVRLTAQNDISTYASASKKSYNAKGGYQRVTNKGQEATITATKDVSISAKNTLTLTGAKVTAGEDMTLSSNNGKVAINSLEMSSDYNFNLGNGYNKGQTVTNVASSLDAKNITVQAKTLNVKSSDMNAKETIGLTGVNDVNILAANNLTYQDTQIKSSSGFMGSKTQRDMTYKESVVSSQINANDISLTSSGDINLQSANINAKKALSATTEGNLNIVAKEYKEGELHESTKEGFLGLSSKISVDASEYLKLKSSKLTLSYDDFKQADDAMNLKSNNLNIVASQLDAANKGINIDAQDSINIASGIEETNEQHIKESTGLSLGISGGKLTYAQITKDSKTDTTITNKASSINADNIVLTSKGDTNILASNLEAKTMQVTTQKALNIMSDQDVKMHNEEHSKKDIGIELTLNTKEASLFAGYWEDTKGKTTTNKDVAKSTLNIDSLDVSAKNVNIVGSDVFTNEMSIDSENTKVLSSKSTTDTQSYTKSVKSGVSVGVKQNISDTFNSIKNIADAKEATGGISRTLKAYDAVNSFLQKPVDAGVYAIYEQSSTSTQASMEQAVASNLHAANSITLRSDENIEVGGSTIYAANNLNIEAKNIDIHSTTQNYSQSTTSDSRNAKAGLYGSDMGEVTLGFQDASQDTHATTESNSYVVAGNKATITSEEDTTLKGAIVSANNLEVNAGRNLNMQSVQDTQSIKGKSIGGTVSGNVAAMTLSGASVNAGSTKGDKKWVNEVTSLNGKNSIKVSVADTTTLKGASITNMDASGIDKGNLQLNTKELKSEDIYDHDNYKSTNIGVGFGSIDSKPSLNSIDFTNSTKEKEQIVRATVGEGAITTDSDISNLNRDVTKTKEITKEESSNLELYASSSSLQALSNPEQAYDNLKQNIKDLGLASYKEIVENLPSANKIADESKKDDNKDTRKKVNDFIDNTIGKVLDSASFTGLLPSQKNAGGYVTQIATQLFGDNRQSIVVNDKTALLKAGVQEKDIQEVILLKTKDGIKELGDLKADEIVLDSVTVFRTDPNKTIIIGDPSEKTGNPNLEAYKIRLSEEDIKNSGIKHIFTNGMLNSIETAIYNQQTQQGYADGMLNYNQQHGFIGDLLESTQDALVVNTGISPLGTGGSRQTGEAITQMTQITKSDLTVGTHSQGTLMSQVGMTQNIEELSNIVQSNPESKFFVGYAGSPVNHNEGEALVTEIYGGEEGIREHIKDGTVSDVFRSLVAPEDFVGSVLGWQSAGINNSDNLGSNIWESLIATPRLFGIGGDSSHSYYPCIIGCGNENYTPDIKNYYTPSAKDGVKEHSRAEYYQDNFTNEKGQMTINMDLLPKTNTVESSLTVDLKNLKGTK